MCIQTSVGKGGTNQFDDVVVIQVLLNFSRPVPMAPVGVDGRVGSSAKSETVSAISEFQSRVQKMGKPDGRVDPGGKTLAALRNSLPDFDSITSSSNFQLALRGIMTRTYPSRVQLYAQPLLDGMADSDIDSALRAAHFLAQLGHESASLVYSEELASGGAYEGRSDLGNTQPGDGKRFKGRGLIQLTGRKNYTAYADSIDKNLTDGENPKRVATDPSLAVGASCWFWSTNKLNEVADKDDVLKVSKIVNGDPPNGLASRQAYLRRAKFFFGL